MPRPKKTIIEYRNYNLSTDFPILILSGSDWHISDVKSNRLHFHNCMEIGICHTDNGAMEFMNTPYPFQAGDVTVVSRNIPHTTYSAPGKSSLWSYIFLQPEGLLSTHIINTLEPLGILGKIEQNFFKIMSQTDYPQIHFLAHRILSEMFTKPVNYQESVRSLCTVFLIELIRLYQEEPALHETMTSHNALTLAPALDYIHENYNKQFPIEQLADLCQLSPTHFRRIFQEIMRCAPLEFIHHTRILQACTLLRSTEESIITISESVGYLSLSSFNRHFLSIMNVSPSEWRKKYTAASKQSISMYSGWILPEHKPV